MSSISGVPLAFLVFFSMEPYYTRPPLRRSICKQTTPIGIRKLPTPSGRLTALRSTFLSNAELRRRVLLTGNVIYSYNV
jgi:hypothetical protein